MFKRFNVGDKVRTKKDLTDGGTYEGIHLLPSMVVRDEPITIVSEPDDDGDCKCSNGYYYNVEMLEPFGYEIGDKVRIRSTRGETWNFEGKMDKWMGKVMTIKEKCGLDTYFMEEDKAENGGTGWAWGSSDFEEIVTTQPEDGKFKVGDRVKAIRAVGHSNLKDIFGTIIEVQDRITFQPYLVEFDEGIKGHSGNGIGKASGKAGHCWWCEAAQIELAPYCKFKVGDVVIGNDEANEHYSMTRKGWIGKVVKVHDNGEIDAKAEGDILAFNRLNPEYFDLYTGDQSTKIVITTDGTTTTAKMYRDETLIDTKTAYCHPDDTFDFMIGARVAFDRLVGETTEKKEEAPKGTLKIEIGKKYKLKDYDEVTDHWGKSRRTWEHIQKAGAVTVIELCREGAYKCDTGYEGVWHFRPESFECEWEEPIKYYNGKVICVDPTGIDFYTKGKIYQFINGRLTRDNGWKTDQYKSFKHWKDTSIAEWLEVVE